MAQLADLKVLHTAKTYRAARSAKRIFLMNGQRCKIYSRSGIYTQPGRGIVAFQEYIVAAV
jgi:hypothetical protein